MSHNLKLTIITVLVILTLVLAGLATYFFVYKKTPIINKGPEVTTYQNLNDGTYEYFFKGEISELDSSNNQIKVRGVQGTLLTFRVYFAGLEDSPQKPEATAQSAVSSEQIDEEIRKINEGLVTPVPPLRKIKNQPTATSSAKITYTQLLGSIINTQVSSLNQILKVGDNITVSFVTDYQPTQMITKNNQFNGPVELYIAKSINK